MGDCKVAVLLQRGNSSIYWHKPGTSGGNMMFYYPADAWATYTEIKKGLLKDPNHYDFQDDRKDTSTRSRLRAGC